MESHTCQICGKPAVVKVKSYLNCEDIATKMEINHEQTYYLCGKHYNDFLKAIKGVGVLGAIFQKTKKEK